MPGKDTTHEWVLLIHQLPPKPTNLRVRIWRKLQKLGAVAIKNSVYVLPATEKTNEDFQWLKQDIESAGGEASVFKAASVEGATRIDPRPASRAKTVTGGPARPVGYGARGERRGLPPPQKTGGQKRKEE